MRSAIPLLTACLLSSCARPDYGQRWPAPLMFSAGPQPGFAIKPVVEKEAPAVLLADDGSVCRTSAQRFRRTAVGKWVACNWQLPDPDA